MGKKSSPSPPPAPDPAKVAQAQAEANRVTQFTPAGDIVYGKTDASGNFTPSSGTALQINQSPEGAALFDAQQNAARILAEQLAGRVGALPSGPIDLSGLPNLPGVNDFSEDASRLESATFERARGLLDPVFQREEERLRQRLANQGLPQGSEAFSGDLGVFNDKRNEAYTNAALDAVQAGRAEQSRLFGLGSAARGQGFQEAAYQRSLPFNELAAAISGSQIGTPNPTQTPTAPIDVVGPYQMQQNAQMAAYNASNQNRNAGLSGLFGLGAAALPVFF